MKWQFYAMALAVTAVPAAQLCAQQALIVGAAGTPMLRIGTEVPVKLRTELTTQNKALRVGQRFEVETSEAVLLDGHVVIPAGTPGVGEVTSVTNKGMWGKSGHFDIRLLYLRVGDRQVRLSGRADDKGVAGGLGAAAVSAIVFLPAGFFMTGTSARMPAGAIIKGSLDEDLSVAFAAPVVIQAPAPVVAPGVARPALMSAVAVPPVATPAVAIVPVAAVATKAK